MSHKMGKKKTNVSGKSTRRQRYINAIDPIRKKYNCTAAEVSDVFSKLENDLRKTTESLDARINDLTQRDETIKTLKGFLEDADDLFVAKALVKEFLAIDTGR